MSETIIVACKLPHGLEITQPGLPPIVLNGSNHESARNAGGFGITEGVDKDAFESWAALNKGKFPPLDRGLIFSATKVADVAAEGKEKKRETTGFERLDPENPNVSTGRGEQTVDPLDDGAGAYEGRGKVKKK